MLTGTQLEKNVPGVVVQKEAVVEAAQVAVVRAIKIMERQKSQYLRILTSNH